MNNTVLVILAVVVVVFVMRKPAPVGVKENLATPNPDGKQVDAPSDIYASIVSDIAGAIGKVADAVGSTNRVQRN